MIFLFCSIVVLWLTELHDIVLWQILQVACLHADEVLHLGLINFSMIKEKMGWFDAPSQLECSSVQVSPMDVL